MFDKLLMAAAQPVAATDSDQYIANTELLLKGEGTNGQTNNTFVDSSASNHTITRNGDTTQGSFSPFSPKGWSMYVDGTDTTQGIVGPTVSSTLGTGTGDWTVEFWWKLDSYSNAAGTATNIPLVNSKDWYGYGANAFWFDYVHNLNQLRFILSYSGGGTERIEYSSFTAQLNQWYHIAGVKQGNTIRLYLDGQQLGTASCANTSANGFRDTTGGICVGRWVSFASNSPTNTRYGRGHYSNVRVTSSAVYPNGTTFTPSTEPLTAITDCKLLTLQDNRYVDNSSLNSTITAYDNAAIKPTSPFSGNRTYPKASYFSGKFDGSNDYLRCDTALDDFTNTSDNFTIEAWFNSRSSPSVFTTIFGVNYNQGQENNLLVGVRDDNGTPKIALYHVLTTGSGDANYGSFQLNTWNHIAATYDGSSVKLYLNGTQIHSVSGAFTRTLSTCAFCIGAELDTTSALPGNYFDGFISNVRVVKDVLYTTTFTPPTAPLTPVTNTKLLTLQDNYLVDHSSSGHGITNNGGVTLEPESPFSNSTYPLSGTFYSANFDSTNDVVSTGASSDFSFGTGDFTWECWFNRQTSTGAGRLLSTGPSWGTNTSVGLGVYGSTHPYYPNKIFAYSTNLAASTFIQSTDAIVDNRWYHVAFTRHNGTFYVYLNGVLQGSNSNYSGSTENSSTNTLYISGNGAGAGTPSTENFLGYISNARVVKGTALYTTDFTVPAEPLTAVSGTKLLTLQDATIQDNSSSNHSITNNGATVTEIAPFGAELIDRAGSMYFDGDGDSLVVSPGADFDFGTGDFTVETWYYCNALNTSSYSMIIDARDTSPYNVGTFAISQNDNTSNSNKLNFTLWDSGGGGSATIYSLNAVQVGQWYHIAMCRGNGTLKAFVNGVEQGSVSNSYNINSGHPYVHIGSRLHWSGATTGSNFLNGYLSDLRVIKGTALYTSNFTPPTAPLQPITNTKLLLSGNNGGVEDSLGKANCETNGNMAIDTSVKKFGVGSFEGGQSNSDYVSFPADASYDISNGVFTIECWFRNKGSSGGANTGICAYGGGANAVNSSTGYQYNFRSSSTGQLIFLALNSAKNASNDLTSATGVISQNTWHYIVAVGNGSTYSLFVDGTRVATNTTSKPHSTSAPTYFSVGGFGAQGGNSQGCAYYDDFRFTNGVARYDPTQTSHTVPTKTHPTV